MPFNRISYIILVAHTLLISCQGVSSPSSNQEVTGNILGLLTPKDSVYLDRNKGLVYYQDELFTGTTVLYYPNKTKASTTSYTKGKKDGKTYKWFQDGLKSYEATYANGRLKGHSYTWWSSGHKRSASFYEKGVPHGDQWQWYSNGHRFKHIQLQQGKEEGIQRSWRKNGTLYSNYEAKNGRIFGLKRANLCFSLEEEEVQLGE